MITPTTTRAVAVALAAALAACAHSRGPATPEEAPIAPLPAGGHLAPPAPAEPPIAATARAAIAAVGDVLMHEAVKRSAAAWGDAGAAGGFPWLYAPVADLLQRADLAFANLETPIAPSAGRGTREYVFNAPADAARALAAAGVDVVSVANNHAFDQGRAGFEETLATLDGLGIRRVGAGPAGAASGPVSLDVGGLRLAFLGWAHFFNQDGNDCAPAKAGSPPCLQAARLDRDAAVAAVAEAAATHDAVIVSLHWGDEYQQQPRAEDVVLAHRLADAGAAIVIGHHPHVLQPIEIYRREDGRASVIAYSLGNFVSNQSRGYVFGVTPEATAATRDGAILEVELVRRDYGRGVVEVEVGGAGYVPLWTENDTAEIDPRREPDRRPRIRVVAIARALAEVRAALAAFPDPVPRERAAEWTRLRRQEALLQARREAIGRVLGADLERPVPPPTGAPPGQ